MIAASTGGFSCGQVGASSCAGDGDEVGAEEHPAHAVEGEDRLGQRRDAGASAAAELPRALAQHVAAGQELQHFGIGGGFGLDEHGRALR